MVFFLSAWLTDQNKYISFDPLSTFFIPTCQSATYKKAKSLLKSLHPASFNILLEGGATASVPIPHIVNVCNGKGYTSTQAG